MAYRIRTLGSRIVVGTEDEAILICKTLAVAEQAVADAEQAPTIPTLQLLAEHAARLNATVPADDAAATPLDEITPAAVGLVPSD